MSTINEKIAAINHINSYHMKVKTVGEFLEELDRVLKPVAESCSVHWGFYNKSLAVDSDLYCKPWPEEICIVMRQGPNEGIMVELWSFGPLNPEGSRSVTGPKMLLGTSKVLGFRADACNYALAIGIATRAM